MADSKIEYVWENDAFGIEFDWIATDLEGKIAYFTTAGAGPLPTTIEFSVDNVEDLYQEVLKLPLTGEYEQTGTQSQNVQEWIEVAKRGIYAFDWRRKSKSYELIALPSSPIVVRELKSQMLQHRALGIQLPLKLANTIEILCR